MTTLILIQIIVSFLLQYWTSIPMMGGVKTQVLKPETYILHIFVPFGLFFHKWVGLKTSKSNVVFNLSVVRFLLSENIFSYFSQSEIALSLTAISDVE